MSKKAFFAMSILIVSIMYLYNTTNSSNRVIFLDVGQGDGIIIQYEGDNYFIDGGPDSTVLHKLGKYINPYKNSPDMLILTHPHSDHIEGFLDLYKIYTQSSIIINEVEYNRADWSWFLHTDDRFIDSYLLQGQCWNGDNNIALIDALGEQFALCFMYPVDKEEYDKNINNSSIVNILLTKYKVIWLMGDAQEPIEDQLISLYKDIDFGNREVILKAGHHCSDTSSSLAWIEFIKPDLVICSVGSDNKYGHPSKEVIELFDQKGIKYLTTMEEGDIIIDI